MKFFLKGNTLYVAATSSTDGIVRAGDHLFIGDNGDFNMLERQAWIPFTELTQDTIDFRFLECLDFSYIQTTYETFKKYPPAYIKTMVMEDMGYGDEDAVYYGIEESVIDDACRNLFQAKKNIPENVRETINYTALLLNDFYGDFTTLGSRIETVNHLIKRLEEDLELTRHRERLFQEFKGGRSLTQYEKLRLTYYLAHREEDAIRVIQEEELIRIARNYLEERGQR